MISYSCRKHSTYQKRLIPEVDTFNQLLIDYFNNGKTNCLKKYQNVEAGKKNCGQEFYF